MPEDTPNSLEPFEAPAPAVQTPGMELDPPEAREMLEPSSPTAAAPAPRHHNELLALVVAIVGWTLPGGGHLLLRRWGRALVAFGAVAILAFVGLKMRGNVFPPRGADAFDFLGFIADAGAGVFYLLAKTVEAAGPDVSRAAGDYGTRLVAAAGVLNLLIMLDAVQIARGEKG
jgi:hypothetical protein